MLQKLLDLYLKFDEIINYLIVGFLTTVVSMGSFSVLVLILNTNYLIANAISWILAVTFAYFTNKIFVFKSKRNNFKENVAEMLNFFSTRIVTLIINYVLLIIFVELFHINEVTSQLIAQIIILITNYIFAKWVVFKK